MEPSLGLEPKTPCLQNRCSAIELGRHAITTVTPPTGSGLLPGVKPSGLGCFTLQSFAKTCLNSYRFSKRHSALSGTPGLESDQENVPDTQLAGSGIL